MKKKLIILLMFLLSCIAIYSNDVNTQSDSNSFSSENFLKKLTSLTPYKNNNINGSVKKYDKEGKLLKETSYKDGVEIKK